MAKTVQGGKMSFLFRELPQNILIGTASDSYAAWIGSKGKETFRMQKGADVGNWVNIVEGTWEKENGMGSFFYQIS